MAQILQMGRTHCGKKKEKLLVTSNFSFSYGVFKRLVLQKRKIQGLFGKGINLLVGKSDQMVSSDRINQDQTTQNGASDLILTLSENEIFNTFPNDKFYALPN